MIEVINNLIEQYRPEIIEAVKEMDDNDVYMLDVILKNMLTDMRIATVDNIFDKMK